jgi:DNA-3-methyladenine glycosylase II
MSIDTITALQYFSENDPVMADLLSSSLTGERPMTLPKRKPKSQYFASIVSSIVGQQISVKAAAAVRGRVVEKLGTITPDTVVEVDFWELKNCGLSEKKTRYIKQNAELWHKIPISDFVLMEDEEIITELTKLYGIGRWTAEMFMMFSLARPDVFSYGDYGLMKSLYKHYNYKPHYVRKIANTVDCWSPHRTLASLALWHQLDNAPTL